MSGSYGRHRAEGFIFKVRDRAEADRIFSIFTKEEGRIELYAKAVRKIQSKLRGGTELFSFCEVEFIQGRTKKTLTDAVKTSRFAGIVHAPEKFLNAGKISRMFDEFMGHQEPDEHVFELLKTTFEQLEILEADPHLLQLLSLYFFWNFMDCLGYRPELNVCVHCRRSLTPNGLGFSSALGGVVCSSCAPGNEDIVSLPANALKIIRLMLDQEWETLQQLKANPEAEYAALTASTAYYRYRSSMHGAPIHE